MRIHPAIWISIGLVVAGISLNLAGSFWIFTLLGIIFVCWGIVQIILAKTRPIHQNRHAHSHSADHAQYQQEKDAPVICPACHGPLHSRYNFCPRCGKKVR